jgi:hypothetical protein
MALIHKRFRLKWMLPAMLLGIITALAFAPGDEWPDRVMKALMAWDSRFPQEKVYLHVDRDYYAGGESIWFKAYVMMQGQPSLSATNLYVELLDRNGIIVNKKMLPIIGAGAAGSFELPENTKPGLYQLRAYTAWMLNFDQAFIYYKNIEIFDPVKKNAPVQDSTPGHDFAVQFFPEGGNLILNAANTVAFKAINQSGYPIAITGNIQDSKNKNVVAIVTKHDGMGSFDFTPERGETYHASVQTSDGQSREFKLPIAQNHGATLKIYNRGSKIFYQTILANQDDSSYGHMMVIAQMQQQLVYKAMMDVSEGRISGFIPTNGLPTGILQVTLFTTDTMPIAERLVFVRKNDQLPISLENATINNEERQKNTLDVILPDTMPSSMSISITDADQVTPNEDQHNILSNMLLTSDLKGYIYNPAWYFKDSSQATVEGLDLVMMTNGWRRFNWAKVLANDTPVIRYPYERYITLKGVATTNNGAYPLRNGRIDFIMKHPIDSTTSISQTNTNDKGEFALNDMQFTDTLQIYYQGNDKAKLYKNVDVQFTKHFFQLSPPVTTPYPYRIPSIDNSKLNAFLNIASDNNRTKRAMTNRAIQLKAVDIRDRKITPAQTMDQKYTSGLFSGGDGYSFDLTKETPYAQNIFQYLQGKVAGLQITGDINNPSMSWRGAKPTLFLNEMQIDVQTLANTNVNDVALVKVFRPPFMGAPGGGSGGAIAVYTKRGDDVPNNDDQKGFGMYKRAGYAISKEFYAPDYSVHKDIYELADKRLTLYWNPYLHTEGNNHKASITFYNNDMSRHFRVVVEGMTLDGRVGHVEKVY